LTINQFITTQHCGASKRLAQLFDETMNTLFQRLKSKLRAEGYDLRKWDKAYGIVLKACEKEVYSNPDLTEIEDWCECNLR
jgi:hypothetical protein